MTENLANLASTTIATDGGSTSITVASSSGFPPVNFRIVVDSELMLVTNVAGTTWTVTRALENTSQVTHSTGATVTQVLTVGGLTAFTGWQPVPSTTSSYECAGQYVSESYAATTAINWNNGNVQYLTLLSGSQTITMSSPVSGGRYILLLTQPTSGSPGYVYWPAIRWSGGSPPTLSTTNSTCDLISLVYIGSSYFGSVAYNF